MSKIVKQNEPSIDQRVENIHRYQACMGNALSQWAAYGVLAGIEMIVLKKQVGHGEWEDFFEKRIKRPKFSLRTAQICMGVANACKGKMLKNADAAFLELMEKAPSQMSPKESKIIETQVSKIVDGKTFTEFATSCGVIKKGIGHGLKNSERKHNPGNGGGGEDTPEQAAIDIWKPIIENLESEGLNEKSFADLPSPWMKRLKGALVDLNKIIPSK